MVKDSPPKYSKIRCVGDTIKLKPSGNTFATHIPENWNPESVRERQMVNETRQRI